MTDSQKLDLILTELQGVKGDVKVLKSDVEGLKGDVKGLKSDVEGLKGDVKGLKGDVQGLKIELQNVKSEIQGMKSEMRDMKSDIKALKDDVRRLDRKVTEVEIHIETVTDRNISFIAEGHLDLNRKLDDALKVEHLKELYFIRTNMIDDEIRKIKDRLAKTA